MSYGLRLWLQVWSHSIQVLILCLSRLVWWCNVVFCLPPLSSRKFWNIPWRKFDKCVPQGPSDRQNQGNYFIWLLADHGQVKYSTSKPIAKIKLIKFPDLIRLYTKRFVFIFSIGEMNSVTSNKMVKSYPEHHVGKCQQCPTQRTQQSKLLWTNCCRLMMKLLQDSALALTTWRLRTEQMKPGTSRQPYNQRRLWNTQSSCGDQEGLQCRSISTGLGACLFTCRLFRSPVCVAIAACRRLIIWSCEGNGEEVRRAREGADRLFTDRVSIDLHELPPQLGGL